MTHMQLTTRGVESASKHRTTLGVSV